MQSCSFLIYFTSEQFIIMVKEHHLWHWTWVPLSAEPLSGVIIIFSACKCWQKAAVLAQSKTIHDRRRCIIDIGTIIQNRRCREADPPQRRWACSRINSDSHGKNVLFISQVLNSCAYILGPDVRKWYATLCSILTFTELPVDEKWLLEEMIY